MDSTTLSADLYEITVNQFWLLAALIQVLVYVLFEVYIRVPFSYLGFSASNEFHIKSHPKLYQINNRICRYLQDSDSNPQLIDTLKKVLDQLRFFHSDIPNVDLDQIRQHFVDHWPSIRPLDISTCLIVEPLKKNTIRTCWGKMTGKDRNISITGNPYLVQALEAAKEVSSTLYSLFTT